MLLNMTRAATFFYWNFIQPLDISLSLLHKLRVILQPHKTTNNAFWQLSKLSWCYDKIVCTTNIDVCLILCNVCSFSRRCLLMWRSRHRGHYCESASFELSRPSPTCPPSSLCATTVRSKLSSRPVMLIFFTSRQTIQKRHLEHNLVPC